MKKDAERRPFSYPKNGKKFSQSNILCEKARNALRCKAFQIYARKSRKFELVVDTEKRLVYTVIRLKLESFRKVCYFAKKQFKRTENFIQLSSVTSCGCAL